MFSSIRAGFLALVLMTMILQMTGVAAAEKRPTAVMTMGDS